MIKRGEAAFGNMQGKPIPITRAEMLLDAQVLGADFSGFNHCLAKLDSLISGGEE